MFAGLEAVASVVRELAPGKWPYINLFPNYAEVEKEYYQRTKIYPIMHMTVMRRAIYEQDPSLAVRLSQGFQAAKELAFEDYEEGLASLPWVNLDMEYARQVLGKDVAPYGVKNNAATLEAATLYSHEQGLTLRKFAVEELFAKETLGLFS